THLSLASFSTALPTTQTYTLSLHDALPISARRAHSSSEARPDDRPPAHALSSLWCRPDRRGARGPEARRGLVTARLSLAAGTARSEEHTSELQSRSDIVCRLLLEKKK